MKITDRVIALEEEVVGGLFRGKFELDSKILLNGEGEKLKFLLESLKMPKRIELLYRGSENQFLVSEFHKKCDGNSGTVTLIET